MEILQTGRIKIAYEAAGSGDAVEATGTLFRCCFILGNIFNLPDADGKAMLCSYFSAPDLPEPGLRLG